MDARSRILADTRFAQIPSDVCTSLDDRIRERFPSFLAGQAERHGWLRGVLAFWLGRSFELIVTGCHARGAWTLLFLEAWLGRRRPRVVLLEFIHEPPRRHRRLLYSWWFARVTRPALRRGLRLGHVLTPWERDHYAEMYGVARERFHFVPWPLRNKAGCALEPHAGDTEPMVLASGRSACDWETLFRAASGRSWPLTVVCGGRDLRRVRRLNRNGRARVFCDISAEEHARALEAASVYVLCLRESHASCGQVRLMTANQAGVAVVASRVKGLDGYVVDGETGMLVEPGDPGLLRGAVEALLADPERRARLGGQAFERAGRWTFSEHRAAIGTMVLGLLA